MQARSSDASAEIADELSTSEPWRPRRGFGYPVARGRELTRRLAAWALAPHPSLRGRWLFLRIVGGCFVAAFYALHETMAARSIRHEVNLTDTYPLE